MTGEERRIARRAGVVAAGTLGSRVLGLVRDVVITATFGKSLTDAFFLAFTIPNTLRRLLGEGALTASFVPLFAETVQKEGPTEARRFVARTSGALLVVLIGVCALGMFFAREVVLLFAAGFRDDPDKFETTVTLTRWMFPYIGLMGLAALATGVLQTQRRFFATAFAPILLNVALIAAVFALRPALDARGVDGVLALALGVLAGGVLQVAALLPSLAREGMLAAPALRLSDPRVRAVGRRMLPGIFALAVYQLDVMLSRQLASGLPGAVTYLYLAQRIAELPLGVFVVSLASAALPSFARMAAREAWTELRSAYGYSLRMSLFVTAPAAMACVFLARPVVATLFQRGEFTAAMTDGTAYALALWGAGIWAVAGARQTVPIFHALGDTRTPSFVAFGNLVVFVGSSVLLMPLLGHGAIALGVTLAATFQFTTLVLLLRRKVGLLGLRSVASSVTRIAVASVAMVAASRGVAVLGDWSAGGTPVNMAVLTAALAAGLVAYLVVARIAGSPELAEIAAAVTRRRGEGKT